MPAETKPRRRGTPRSSEITSAAGRNRWSPDARTREAVRVLVAELAPLTDDQKDALRPLLKSGE